jgi:nucleoside-diphosphate-sugar epimerase
MNGFASREAPAIGLVRAGGDLAPAFPTRRVAYDSPESLDAAFAGAETVVHLAGRAHALGESAADGTRLFEEINVQLTRRVAEAASRAVVKRFILMSSVSAVASHAPVRLTGEEAPEPDTAYGRSKLAAERVVREVFAGTRTGLVILRPPMIYGPDMRGNPLRMFRLVARRLPLPLGGIRNARSVLYVGNLVDAILRIVAQTPTSFTSFIRDREEVSTPELAREIGNALEVPVRLWPVPPGLLRAAGAIGDLFPPSIPFPLRRAAATGLTESLLLDSSPLGGVIGPIAPTSLGTGLRLTAGWFRATHAAQGSRA